MFSNPYVYQLVDFLFSVPIVEHIFTLSDSVLRALAMIEVGIDGVNSNPALGPDKFVAKILCGTLAGCGGGLWIGKFIYTYVDVKGEVEIEIVCVYRYTDTNILKDAFRLNQPVWSFSTPRLLHVASVDMKISFATTLFYLATTTPAVVEYLNLPELKIVEAQAWSVVFLTSGLVYGTYADRWAKQAKAVKELNEKTSSVVIEDHKKSE